MWHLYLGNLPAIFSDILAYLRRWRWTKGRAYQQQRRQQAAKQQRSSSKAAAKQQRSSSKAAASQAAAKPQPSSSEAAGKQQQSSSEAERSRAKQSEAAAAAAAKRETHGGITWSDLWPAQPLVFVQFWEGCANEIERAEACHGRGQRRRVPTAPI